MRQQRWSLWIEIGRAEGGLTELMNESVYEKNKKIVDFQFKLIFPRFTF